MIPILEYIAQVHERTQKTEYIKCTPHMDLVEDFMFVMESNNLVFYSDKEVLDYLDSVIRNSRAFNDFKRNYKAWFRRHKY